MRKLTILAGAAAITLASVGTAEAQRWRHGDGWRGDYHHRYYRGSRWGNGGALAAGLIGGAVLGGLLTAAATPTYAYPGYGYAPYGYPAYGYRYGYSYPAAYGYPAYSDPSYGYYAAPVTRVVYRPAPVYRTRVVYREPIYGPRVVYRQPRRVTRVVYRDRGRLVRSVRRDVVTTGSIGRHNVQRIRRIEGVYR